MYALEVVFNVVALLFLATQVSPRFPRGAALACFVAGAVIIAVSAILNQTRWQMVPGYLLFLVLTLLLLKRSHAHLAVRVAGVSMAVLLLTAGVLLPLAFPITTFPDPDGPDAVGSASFWLVDTSRDDGYFGWPGKRRELYVQAWYPAKISRTLPPPRIRTMWEELYKGKTDRVAFFTGYLRGIQTHTYDHPPLLEPAHDYPLVVFSHGLGMLAEQNTPLMEHLASHGYVVLAIGHSRLSARVRSSGGTTIRLDVPRMMSAMQQYEAIDLDAFEMRAQLASDDLARARVLLEPARQTTLMNELMAILVADIRFVLDAIGEPASFDARFAALLKTVDRSRIGLMGMSIGGGAITEVCKIDMRCHAGLNIDGGMFGQYQLLPLLRPFLGLIHAENQKFNDYLLLASQNDYYEVLVKGAQHPDFCDLSFLAPGMKWLKINGSIEAARVVEIANVAALRFFDAYLRDGPKPRFGPQQFPELQIRMNSFAQDY